MNIRITITIHCHLPRFLESVVLPCFRYASAGDRQCITLGQSLWTIDQFLVTNKLKVCELCIYMIIYIIVIYMILDYWFNQIHVDKPHHDHAAIGPESTQCCKPDSAPFWHICEDVTFCENDKYFFQSHIKIVLRCKIKLLFNRI